MDEKILLVEDEAGAAQNVKMELDGSGYELRWVRSVREARALLPQYQPDVLLLDLTLEVDGLEFFQGLRQAGREPDAGTVLLVDDRNTALRERAHQMGPAAVVTKPLQVGVLMAAISDLLNFRE